MQENAQDQHNLRLPQGAGKQTQTTADDVHRIPDNTHLPEHTALIQVTAQLSTRLEFRVGAQTSKRFDLGRGDNGNHKPAMWLCYLSLGYDE